MSTIDQDLDVPSGTAHPAGGAEVTTARLARVGDIEVRRLLPLRQRRSVGAWCFVDHYGPASVDGVTGMRVPPHPHIGLQTVTWLIEGTVLHRDSLGSEQLIRPGQLNLMTAGRGIAHSEESPDDHGPALHGVQLWLALPDAYRHVAPDFEHLTGLPVLRVGGLDVTVFAGSMGGAASPARVFSPLVGAEIAAATTDASGTLSLDAGHEHVLFAAAGTSTADGTVLAPGTLLYLPVNRESVAISARGGSRLLLLGGEPLRETLLMWWNFVGRSPGDIIAAVDDWAHERYGTVHGYRGAPLAAPPLDAVRLGRRSAGAAP